EEIIVKNGKVEGMLVDEQEGFGVRVVADGAWGFAASHLLTPTEADRIAALAVRIAKASALAKRVDVQLGPPVTSVGSYTTPVKIDPFTVSMEDKAQLLMDADDAMRRVPGVTIAESSFQALRTEKLFASTEGSFIEQHLVETGAGLEATAVRDGDVQKRSYPNSFGRHQGTAGYEFVQNLQLVDNAPVIAEQAVQLLSAEQCPSDLVTTVILDPTQLALQIHESCGHPIELDRALGTEASYAGTSFLTADKLGGFRYGSDIVNIVADATVPGGLGTFGFDDEGVAAQRVPIIQNGIFVNYLTSRETATVLGQQSNGSMRADGWNRIPLIRMTNINLEPGPWKLEDLIADTDEGIFMQTNKSWSIDDKRLNFQFGTEIAWEIRGGKLGRMYKNPTYTGITPQFWAGCDAICREWTVWGVVNCGKGQPVQVAHVGHGAAAARFRNVHVGVMR
ncbi:MAG: TldD/PmbA family protein, partial [Chloroflexota bacterium]